MNEIIWQADFQQSAFRQLLEAFSRPGVAVRLPASGGNGTRGVLATLIDGETSLADPHGLLQDIDWLRLQRDPDPATKAAFILCEGLQVVDFEPNLGTLASPELGATLIISVDAVEGGQQTFRLTGPGIETTQTQAPQGLHPSWLQQRAIWNGAYPMGVDMLLVAGDEIAALPRTTHVMEID